MDRSRTTRARYMTSVPRLSETFVPPVRAIEMTPDTYVPLTVRDPFAPGARVKLRLWPTTDPVTT
jgi:hypothetical protein